MNHQHEPFSSGMFGPRRYAWLAAILLLMTFHAGCQTGPFARSSKQTDLASGQNPAKRGLFSRGSSSNRSMTADDVLDPLGERNFNRLLPQDLAFDQIGTTIRSRTAGGNKPDKATEAFNEGQLLYEKALSMRDADPEGDAHLAVFEQAAKQFRMASGLWKDSAMEQDALFYEGESLFFANRYVQSNRAFEKLIALYSGTRYLDKAESRRFAIAQYWLGVSREQKKAWVRLPVPRPERPAFNLAGESRRILNRIRIDDPSGKLADDATMALANAFLEAEMYQEAAETYEDLRKAYPGTPHLFQASLFELKSRMKSYYGNSYDQEPLMKADQLLRQIVRQFPDEAKREQDYLAQEATTIRNLLAERDFTLGKYYEKRGENGAASIMYEQVAQNYPDTELGEQASERYAEVSGKPPLPKQHAEWLVDLMPKSEASKPLIASGDKSSIFR